MSTIGKKQAEMAETGRCSNCGYAALCVVSATPPSSNFSYSTLFFSFHLIVFSIMDSITRATNKTHRLPRNRLLSIAHDVKWVREVHEAYGIHRPLIANERCGLWYVNPEECGETCYFKSTDGHTHQWSFSTRRLNFHLLDVLRKAKGGIIVDSTRRGKTMPDAFSKTIPIWCAVINYIMMDGEGSEQNYLFWPRQIISDSEAHSIMQLIPKFVERVLELGLITNQTIRAKLGGKVLRPIWVYPGMSLPFEPPEYEDFIPVILCVASERADDGSKQMRAGDTHFTYVQGAADDHELWASSLSPELFWRKFETLTNPRVGTDEIEGVIDKVTSLSTKAEHESSVKDITALIDTLHVGTLVADVEPRHVSQYDTVIVLSGDHGFLESESVKFFKYNCPSSKKGSTELRKHLPVILTQVHQDKKTLIVCDSGTDISIGVALAVLSSRYDLNWEHKEGLLVTKDVIKRQLAMILEKKKVNPSRATLQAVNTCLM